MREKKASYQIKALKWRKGMLKTILVASSFSLLFSGIRRQEWPRIPLPSRVKSADWTWRKLGVYQGRAPSGFLWSHHAISLRRCLYAQMHVLDGTLTDNLPSDRGLEVDCSRSEISCQSPAKQSLSSNGQGCAACAAEHCSSWKALYVWFSAAIIIYTNYTKQKKKNTLSPIQHGKRQSHH